MLHAFPLGPEMWAPQRDALDGHEVIVPDLYELDGSWIDGWAEQIWDGLDDDFVAVGLSMSGYVAPSRWRAPRRRAVPRALPGRCPSRRRRRRPSTSPATARSRPCASRAWRAWAPSAPAPPPTNAVEELIRATEALRDRRDWAGFSCASTSGRSGWSSAARTRSSPRPRRRREIVASVPNGRLEVLEGAGHFTNVERRNRFNELLTEFLQAAR